MNPQTFSTILLFMGIAFPLAAIAADNPLSQDDLISATKSALTDYSTNNPEHAKHVSGFRTLTSDADAKVKIYVNHDGMAMESDYLCVRQGSALECHAQTD